MYNLLFNLIFRRTFVASQALQSKGVLKRVVVKAKGEKLIACPTTRQNINSNVLSHLKVTTRYVIGSMGWQL